MDSPAPLEDAAEFQKARHVRDGHEVGVLEEHIEPTCGDQRAAQIVVARKVGLLGRGGKPFDVSKLDPLARAGMSVDLVPKRLECARDTHRDG